MFKRLTTVLTFRRIFPVAFFLMVFSLAVLQCSYIDPDLWWHLRTGQDILANHTIPHTDIYSYTKAGSEWVTHEWLSEVIFFSIFRVAGWAGLITILSTLIAVAVYIAYRRCEGKPYVAAFSILLAAAASAPLFGIRPQMLSFLLTSIYIALLSRFLTEERTKLLWPLPAMMLLWVNLHAGYALGLGLIGLYAVSAALDGKWRLLRPLGLSLLVSTAVVPLNPNGLRMFSYPLETLRSPSMAAYIEEWASPNFHQVTYLPLALLLFVLIGVLAMSPKRTTLGEVFLIVVTGFGALRSVRHIPIFALIAAPVIARNLWAIMVARSWEKWFTKPEAPAMGMALAINLLLLLSPIGVACLRVGHFVTYQQKYEAKNYPQKAVDFLAEKQLTGPIYNQYGWGGYLIKRLYPNYRVYIDGRADVYGDAFMIEAMRTYDGREGWKEPLDRLSISTVLVSPDAPIASLLRVDGEWKTAYEDEQAVIFTRPQNTQTVANLEASRAQTK
jgi:hypothetical protein